MAELTIEQQKALALAKARLRAQQTPAANNEIPIADPMAAPAGAFDPNPATGYTPSSVPILDAANAFGTSLAENIPIIGKPLSDFGNSVDAAFASMVEGRPVTSQERAQITQAEQDQFPAASVSGAVAGNVLPMVPLASTQIGARALGMTGPLAGRVAAGAGSGAIIAGADAAVDTGGDMAAAADSALWGAGFGAVGGAAAPYIDDALSALGRTFGARGATPADSIARPTREMIIRAMDGDGALSNGAGRAAMQAAGPDAMLVDASPSAVGMLDAALQRSGPGSSQARQAIDTRAANANTTINRALDDALGPAQGVTATETGLRRGTAAARDAAYTRAYSQPIDYSAPAGMEAERLLTRVPQGVIGLANRMMQLEGEQSAQILARIADDGTVTYMRMPDVRQIDYITRALNQAAKSGEGQGALGGQTDIGRLYGQLARQIRDATRSAVPAYDEALRTAAQPIQMREGLRFGEGMLSASVTRDEAREAIEAMTEPQVAAARQGVRSYIDDVLANVREAVSDPNIDAREALKALNELGSRAAREKISMVLDNPAAANRLFAQILQARRALELRAGVSTNSRTFGRLAVDEAVSDLVSGGAINAALRGEPLNAGRRAVQNFTGRTPAGEAGLKDRAYAEIANALTLQGPQALDMLESLRFRAANPKPNAPFLPGLAQYGEDQGFPIFAK